ncbi:MAG: redoxin domain-containing protein [Dehalococcoidia bacterium]|nr:redoxin domain-containing protein [Dehalococcoidia bacterium]
MSGSWIDDGFKAWLTRVFLLMLFVSAGTAIAFGLGIIGGRGQETIINADGVIVVDEANILAPGETEVATGEGEELDYEVVESGTPGTSGDTGIEEGQIAPNFATTTLEGERVQLADFRGRIVILNFWATWCGPCRAEMPAMHDIQDIYRDEVVVIALNNQEAYSPALRFIEELGVNFEAIGLDPSGNVVDEYRVFTMPTSYFIGRDGVIFDVHLGQVTFDEMIENIEAVLDS